MSEPHPADALMDAIAAEVERRVLERLDAVPRLLRDGGGRRP